MHSGMASAIIRRRVLREDSCINVYICNLDFIGNATLCFSEIYSPPRFVDTLENSVSFGSSCLVNAANNLSHVNSNSIISGNATSLSSANSVQSQQKHRIDALTQISAGTAILATTSLPSATTSSTPLMDAVVDSKSRQGW